MITLTEVLTLSGILFAIAYAALGLLPAVFVLWRSFSGGGMTALLVPVLLVCVPTRPSTRPSPPPVCGWTLYRLTRELLP